MAQKVAFGADLTYRCISPDEIALMAYYALKCGIETTDLAEAIKIRTLVRNLLPVFEFPQVAVLATVFDTDVELRPEWLAFRVELFASISE